MALAAIPAVVKAERLSELSLLSFMLITLLTRRFFYFQLGAHSAQRLQLYQDTAFPATIHPHRVVSQVQNFPLSGPRFVSGAIQN